MGPGGDPAACGHPLHLYAGADHAALVAIVDCAIKNKRHRFESRVGMRSTDRAVADVEMVIGESMMKGSLSTKSVGDRTCAAR